MIAGDALRIGRVILRGTASAVDHARTTLPAALARAHWPADDAIVVVRRVAVGGTATELPGRAAVATEHLARRAADPWSPAADSAEAVRFRDALDYRACLVRDLLAGTAARRWLWRHRAALLARPAAEALAELLAEDALALPALLDRPALRASLPALWHTLDAPAALTILHTLGAATGWHGAIARALDPTTHQRRAEKRSAFRRMSQQASTTPPPPIAYAADNAFGSSALRSRLPAGLGPSDPRVVLHAALALWAQAPATLATATGGEALRAVAEIFTRPVPAAAPGSPAAREAQAPTANASLKTSKSSSDTPPSPPADNPVPATSPLREATPADHATSAATRDTLAGDALRNPSAPPHRVSSAAPDAALPPAADVDFHTRGGGFFFLLNVLNLPALRDWRATLAEPHAGWRELVRLARWLDFTPDAPLAAFLVDACALETGDDPAAALATLPPGADPAPVRHAAQRRYGEAALAATLTKRPAHIRATASHLDVHLRLAAVDLDIRRSGLDIDPGWLPWLGRVVRFHYDSGGFSP